MRSIKLISAAVIGASLLVSAQTGSAAPAKERYIVMFKANEAAAGKKSLKAAGAVIKRDFVKYNAASVALDTSKASLLASQPGIAQVEVDPRRYMFSQALRAQPSGADRAPADHARRAKSCPTASPWYRPKAMPVT
jgi:hypothetical protein